MFISWKFELLFKQLWIYRFWTGNVIWREEGKRKWQEGKWGWAGQEHGTGRESSFWGCREGEFPQGQAEKPPTHIPVSPPLLEVPWLNVDARETQTSQGQQGLMAPLGVFGFATIIVRVGHYFSAEYFSSRNDLHWDWDLPWKNWCGLVLGRKNQIELFI